MNSQTQPTAGNRETLRIPQSLLLIATLFLTLTGCGPAKVQLSAPNPVGQWRWKDDDLHTATVYVVTADGKFVRETTGPVEPKVAKVSGTWSVIVILPKLTWMEQHGLFQRKDPYDELTRTRTGKYPESTTQWSALGTLSLRYSVPKGTKLVPGATALEPAAGPLGTLDGAPAGTSVEENQPLRIRTETSDGRVFMELGGKTFEKFEGPVVFTPPPPTKEEIAAAELKMKLERQAAALLAEKNRYVTVEPFAGVALQLPRDWHALDPEAAEPAPPSTPVETLVGKPGFAGAKGSWGFVPPGHSGAEMNIALHRQSANAPSQKLPDWPQETIDRLAKSFGETIAPILEGRGYQLKYRATSERVKSGERPAILWQDEAESPSDGILTAQILFVPLEKASVVATFLWAKTPGNTWEPAIEKARTTLRIADSVVAP